AEAGTKTGSKMLQKVIGTVSQTFPCVVFASLIVGAIQTIAGFLVVKKQGKKLMDDKRNVLGACLFGVLATFSTIVPFSIFYLGGDIGVNTFIITLSIVPGALIDRFVFSHKLNRRQWLGIAVAVLAGYSVLGWPSLRSFLGLPLWVWLSFAVMFLNAVNQGITQAVKTIDPFVKNFWGGLMNLALSLGVLAVIGALGVMADISPPMRKLWLAAGIGGLVVIAMWSFNLLSYKGGASIALKKLVMNGAFLVSSMLLGVWVFGEAFTTGKAVGIVLYFTAFALTDNGTWNYIFQKMSKKSQLSIVRTQKSAKV
ncbi:MAG: DMT family transporter, partial [bacterium]|nr:DMT family transporter [bacterium]